MWRKNNLREASLASVGNIFCVDKETEPAEHLFTKDSQHPVGSGFETIGQKLAAGVVGLGPALNFSSLSKIKAELIRLFGVSGRV